MDTHWRDAYVCPLLQSEPSIGPHVSPLNQWEDSTWWKQLSKAPTPCSQFHIRKLALFPVFGKHEYFLKFLKMEKYSNLFKAPPLLGGGALDKNLNLKSLYFFKIFDLSELSALL